MLQFFYKNQKKFIAVIAVIVGVSGIGVGWKRSPDEVSEYSNQVVFKTKSGRKYTDREFSVFKKFFIYEAYPFSGNPNEWNFLNEGLLTERFLTNKVGEKLFLQTYAQGFPKDEWEKQYQSYRRFDAPFISSEEVWKSSAPRLYEALQTLQQANSPVSSEAFLARVRLFLEEKKFPHYVLRQMLEYRRKIFNLPEDSSLFEGKDLRIFGYKHIGDWFGDAYVCESLKTLLRFIDEQKKYLPMPSIQEAQQDFYDKARQSFYKINKYIPSSYTFDQFIRSYFQFFDIEENEFFRLYREILLFKRAFLLLEGTVAFDYQPLQEFFAMGKDSTTIEIVKLPKEYHFKTQDDLEAFETYLHLVCEPTKNLLDLPSIYCPLQTIKRREPKLVGRRFSLSYQKIELHKLEHTIPMAEVHQWYQDSQNFELLLQKFPQLEVCSSAKDFYKLKTSVVNSIHSFVRKEILKSSQERLLEALSMSKTYTHDVFLSPGKDSVLEGIADGQALAAELLNNESLPIYTQDLEHYYAFQVHTCDEHEEVLPFREVMRKGLKQYLLETHANKDFMRQLVNALKQSYPYDREESLWQRRLACVLEANVQGNSLTGNVPWHVEKSTHTLSRGECILDNGFDLSLLPAGGETDIMYHSNEGLCYYRCLSHAKCQSPTNVDKLFFAKNHLNEEILSSYIENFIDEEKR